jgi:gliding motility-associated-like protein
VKKRNVLFALFMALLMAMSQTHLHASYYADTTRFIIQSDTTICKGVSVQLELRDPLPKDTLLPGVWKQLIGSSQINPSLFNIRPFGYDKVNQYLYSIINRTVTRYDLKKNEVTIIPASNWPGDYSEFVYDFTNNRLLCWRSGRDNIYALPANGGAWTQIGAGVTDNECYGASAYWNPLLQQTGIYGGYGSAQVKSWIFEHNGTAWQMKKNNPAIDMVPPKGGNIVAGNKDGSKLYLFSGQGNYSGSELTGACALGSPWATATGIFCWLKDLWELDLSTYQFRNILPVNDPSIQYEGALAYDYNKSRFYLFGGFQPTGDHITNQFLTNTNKTFRFDPSKDAGFTEFQAEGTVMPPAMARTSLPNYAYYDEMGKRVIWARFDGIWAYYPDSTTAPKPDTIYAWSNGATTRNIIVEPTQTTRYAVTRTIGTDISKDSILITVNALNTALTDSVKRCADSTLLDAGTGFSSYLWNDGTTTQTLWAKQSGRYIITVSDGTCSVKDTTEVLLGSVTDDFTIGLAKDSVCRGEADSLFIRSPQAGVTYKWYVPGNPTAIHTGEYLKLNSVASDTTFMVSASGNPALCPAKAANATVIVRKKITTPAVQADNITGVSIRFRWNAVENAIGYKQSIDSGLVYNDPSSGFPGLTHSINGLQPNQTIKLWVKAIGSYACETSDSVKVTATTLNPFGDGIYIPNVFTPNGDGVNDVFLVYGNTIETMRLVIYNQWGQELFITTDRQKGWDGVYKGNQSPAGRYSYALEVKVQSGNKITKAGSFNLIR